MTVPRPPVNIPLAPAWPVLQASPRASWIIGQYVLPQAGKVHTVTIYDPASHAATKTSTYTYDSFGRVISIVDTKPDTTVTQTKTFTYNPVTAPTTVTQTVTPMGQPAVVTTFTLHPDGRAWQGDWSDASGAHHSERHYDSSGFLVSETDYAGTDITGAVTLTDVRTISNEQDIATETINGITTTYSYFDGSTAQLPMIYDTTQYIGMGFTGTPNVLAKYQPTDSSGNPLVTFTYDLNDLNQIATKYANMVIDSTYTYY